MSPSGEYLEIDGRPALRFVRELTQPVDRVWTMLTDPDELVHWFPARPSFDAGLRVGAPVQFVFDAGQCTEPGGSGTVSAVDPPHRLAFSWEGDELDFVLTVTPSGTRLTFTTVVATSDTTARNAAGWHLCLDGLLAHSEGRGAAAADWRPVYEAYVAAGVPAGADLPAPH